MRLVPYSGFEDSDDELPDTPKPAAIPTALPSTPITHTSPQSSTVEQSSSAPESTTQRPQKILQRPLDRLIRPEHAYKLPEVWEGRERLEESSKRLWDIIHSNAPGSEEYAGAHKKLVALTEQLDAEFEVRQQRHPDLALQTVRRTRTQHPQQDRRTKEPTVGELTTMLREYVLKSSHSQSIFYDADNNTFEEAFSETALADYWHQPDYYNEFEIDLDVHCSALDTELELNKQRWNRIEQVLTKNPSLKQALLAELDALIKAAGDTHSAQADGAAKLSKPPGKSTKALLQEKMTTLLLLEKKKTSPPTEPTFPVSAVTTLHPNGKPSDYLTYHLPHTTTWPAFLDALKRLSVSWQSPNGYGPEDGPWWYHCGGNDKMTELTDERAYRELRKLIIEGEGKVKVLLWHSVQIRRAEEGMKEALELRDRRSLSGTELLDQDGKPVFERWFDLEDYLKRLVKRGRQTEKGQQSQGSRPSL